MTAPSQTPEGAGLEVVGWEVKFPALTQITPQQDLASLAKMRGHAVEPLVTAASAQAAIDAEKARADRLAEIASKLDAAIGWLDYPFIDNRTPEAELQQRVGFMMKDAEPHRAALQQETQP